MTRRRLLPKDPPPGLSVRHIMIGDRDEIAILSYAFGPSGLPDTLTKSEREVIELVLEGKSNQEIATERKRAVRTIACQIASAYRKLGVGSRGELVSKYR